MCGGVYEDDFEYVSTNAPRKDKEISKESEQGAVESRNRRVMGDIKFMTAGDFMEEQDEYVYPGSDCQE